MDAIMSPLPVCPYSTRPRETPSENSYERRRAQFCDTSGSVVDRTWEISRPGALGRRAWCSFLGSGEPLAPRTNPRLQHAISCNLDTQQDRETRTETHAESKLCPQPHLRSRNPHTHTGDAGGLGDTRAAAAAVDSLKRELEAVLATSDPRSLFGVQACASNSLLRRTIS